MPRIIPCLDVKDGRVVKGVKFQNLRDTGDPAECAARYAEQGADELVLLDISATLQDRGNRLETVRRVRAVLPIPLTVGGGVRTVQDARKQAGFAVSDRIEISIEGTPKVLEALKSHQDYIAEETLTTAFREQPSPEFTVEKEVEGEALTIKLPRVRARG